MTAATVVVTQSMQVLDFVRATPECVTFTSEPDDNGDLKTVVRLSRQLWDDMGQPPVVTIVVNPNDLLNVKE